MRRRDFSLLLTAAATAPLAAAADKIDDPILGAMRDELQRSLRLRIAGEVPYYIEYLLEDGLNFSCSASLGGLLLSKTSRYRVPRVQVRVGSYEFDNTNSVYTNAVRGTRFDSDQWPLEADREQLRLDFWLATDRAYKGAVEAFSLKRAALQNITQSETLHDFAPQPPASRILPVVKGRPDEKLWNDRVRRLSAVFNKYPKVLESRVEFEEGFAISYYVNSEGSINRTPENISTLRVRGEALAADGTPLRDYLTFHAFESTGLPPEAELLQAVDAFAARLTALCEAPVGEDYTGPVLFSPIAASQLLAQLLITNLAPVRTPVSEPGRPATLPSSDLEGRLGSRVLPEIFNVLDDPSARDAKGRPLFGCFEVDMEGVIPKPLPIVEKGVLKNLLHTRQPVRGHEGSNGRGRLPGNFGAKAGVPGNLLVTVTESSSYADLKTRLLDMVKQRNKPYGLLVAKIDYPSSASVGELRRLASLLQSGGSNKPVALPLVVFKVHADGREELIRGMRFRGLGTRSLRDIAAAGNDPYQLDMLVNTYPLALMGAGGYVTGVSVVAPSLLFDEIDLDRPPEERPHLPIVPPPPLESGR